jgi:hypothetical protein
LLTGLLDGAWTLRVEPSREPPHDLSPVLAEEIHLEPNAGVKATREAKDVSEYVLLKGVLVLPADDDADTVTTRPIVRHVEAERTVRKAFWGGRHSFSVEPRLGQRPGMSPERRGRLRR